MDMARFMPWRGRRILAYLWTRCRRAWRGLQGATFTRFLPSLCPGHELRLCERTLGLDNHNRRMDMDRQTWLA